MRGDKKKEDKANKIDSEKIVFDGLGQNKIRLNQIQVKTKHGKIRQKKKFYQIKRNIKLDHMRRSINGSRMPLHRYLASSTH